MKLSKRVATVQPSATLAITARAAELKAQGVDIVSFGAGEPDFATPAHICEAAKRAIDDGITRYTAVPGLPQLRAALSGFLRERYGMDYSPAELIVTPGGKFGLYGLFQCLLDPGDEVIIPSPYWVSYPEQVVLSEGVPVIVHAGAEQGFRVTPEQIAAAVTPRTKVLIINSPSNPTGAAYTPDQLRAIGEVALEKDLFVISDEIYSELLYDGFPFVSFPTLDPRLRERTAVASGWSKSYSMTGWRMGWVAAPKALVSALSNLQGQSTSNPVSFCQIAAIEAVRGSHDYLKDWIVAFDRRRLFLVDALNAIPGVSCTRPEGAFYVFPDMRGVLDREWNGAPLGTCMRLAQYLLEEARVAVVPGEPFGAPGFVRLSYATSDAVIKTGVERTAEALGKLR